MAPMVKTLLEDQPAPVLDDLHLLMILSFLSTLLIVVAYFWYRLVRIERKFANSTVVEEDLRGKTVLITGANEGIGAEVAKKLANKGARLIFACRDMEKAKLMAESIVAQNATVEISLQHVDLSSMNSVRICANEVLQSEPKIDVIVSCASVAYVPGGEATLTTDGHELHLATNYYGHYLLVHLLVDRLKQTAEERQSVCKVINVCSPIHRVGKIQLQDINLQKQYTPLAGYSQSKLAMILASRDLARKWKASRIHVYCVDPGLTWTESHYAKLNPFISYLIHLTAVVFFQSTTTAAEKIWKVISDPQITTQTGYYYANYKQSLPAVQATDDKMVKNLLEITTKACDISE